MDHTFIHVCGDDCSRRADSPEAVSLSGLEQTVEAMRKAMTGCRGTTAWPYRTYAMAALTAALSTGQIVRKLRAEVERLRAMREITDETVRRACRAYLAERDVWPEESAMRAALRAALSKGERHG